MASNPPAARRPLIQIALDFLTIDVDHTGAAYTTWASDNNARHDTRQYFSRQLAGNSIFTGQNIAVDGGNTLRAFPDWRPLMPPGRQIPDQVAEIRAGIH